MKNMKAQNIYHNATVGSSSEKGGKVSGKCFTILMTLLNSEDTHMNSLSQAMKSRIGLD